MIIPVRCFTCGKPMAQLWSQYKEMIDQGTNEKEALERLNLRRYCCRRMLLSHVELMDKLLEFDSRGGV